MFLFECIVRATLRGFSTVCGASGAPLGACRAAHQASCLTALKVCHGKVRMDRQTAGRSWSTPVPPPLFFQGPACIRPCLWRFGAAPPTTSGSISWHTFRKERQSPSEKSVATPATVGIGQIRGEKGNVYVCTPGRVLLNNSA